MAARADVVDALDQALRAAGLELDEVDDVPEDRIARHAGGSRRLRYRTAWDIDDGVAFTTKSAVDAPIDYWAVWHPATHGAFLVPAELSGKVETRLHWRPGRNRRSTHRADGYTLDTLASDLQAGRWPGVRDTLELSPGVAADLERLGGRYRARLVGPADVTLLQEKLHDARATLTIEQLADVAGLTAAQVAHLLKHHRGGSVSGQGNRHAGRLSAARWRQLAERAAEHPAAAGHLNLLEREPARFVFSVAADATDGSIGEVQAFLGDIGWEVGAASVRARLKQLHGS